MYLYCIVSGNGLFKLGKTEKLKERVRQIKSGSPTQCALLFAEEYFDGDEIEKKYHEKYAKKRVRGEWFALSESDLLEIAPNHHGLKLLIADMESWGFFELGKGELMRGASLATIWRAEALTDNVCPKCFGDGFFGKVEDPEICSMCDGQGQPNQA